MTTHDDEALSAAIRRSFAGYHPSSNVAPVAIARRRRIPRLGLVAVPLVAAVLAVLVSQTLVGPTSVLASWTATPTAADPAMVASITEICRAAPAADAPASDRAFQERLRALPLVAVEQRGKVAAALFANGSANGHDLLLCMGAVNDQGELAYGGSGGGEGSQEHPADGPVRLLTAQRQTSFRGEMVTAYAGSVSADVAKVVVERSAGQDVVATVGGGYFLAWWPGDAAASNVVAFDGGGTVQAEIGNNDWTLQSDAP